MGRQDPARPSTEFAGEQVVQVLDATWREQLVSAIENKQGCQRLESRLPVETEPIQQAGWEPTSVLCEAAGSAECP